MKANRRHKILASTAILGAFLLVGFWIFLPVKSSSYPSYNGKTVDQWFYGDYRDPRRKNLSEAHIAFNAMGTNSIPYLVEKAKGTETPLNRIYCKLYPNLPTFFREMMWPAVPYSYVQMVSFGHLQNFDSLQLDPYAPELMGIVPTIKDNQIRGFAFFVMEDSAVRIDNMWSKTNYFLSFVNDPSFGIQLRSMLLLSEIDNTITNGIPALTRALSERSLVAGLLHLGAEVVDSQLKNDN